MEYGFLLEFTLSAVEVQESPLSVSIIIVPSCANLILE